MNRRGFTLIELLVVVSIIAILSAVGLSTFTSAQRKARDARRRADLKEIQNALEQYYITNSTYPDTMAAIETTTYFSAGGAPQDPRQAVDYIGFTDAGLTTTAYNICADLELTTAGAVDATWYNAASNDVCVKQLQ